MEVLDHTDDLSGRLLVPPVTEITADGVVPAEGFAGGFVDEERPSGVGREVAREVPAPGELEPVETGEIIVGFENIDRDFDRIRFPRP